MQAGKNKPFHALALSFAVYLFPLIGPHSLSFLGELLWRDLARGKREGSWIVMDVGFALFLQLMAFAVLFWLLKKPSAVRVALVLLGIPFAGSSVAFAYMVWIPSRFLIEEDTAGEKGDWPVECSARDVALI